MWSKNTQEVSGWLRHVYSPWMEWYWQCLLLPLLYKTGAVLACAMSAMLTWSEVGTGGVWMAASRVQSRDGVVLQCLLLPLLYKTGAVLTCGMSAMLTWSEVGTRHVYSPWMEWYWQCLLLPPPLQDGGPARLCHVRHAHLVRGRYRRCLDGWLTCTVPGWSGTGSVSSSPSSTRWGPCSPVPCLPCSPGQR